LNTLSKKELAEFDISVRRAGRVGSISLMEIFINFKQKNEAINSNTQFNKYLAYDLAREEKQNFNNYLTHHTHPYSPGLVKVLECAHEFIFGVNKEYANKACEHLLKSDAKDEFEKMYGEGINANNNLAFFPKYFSSAPIPVEKENTIYFQAVLTIIKYLPEKFRVEDLYHCIAILEFINMSNDKCRFSYPLKLIPSGNGDCIVVARDSKSRKRVNGYINPICYVDGKVRKLNVLIGNKEFDFQMVAEDRISRKIL
jgi:hypothetical protein